MERQDFGFSSTILSWGIEMEIRLCQRELTSPPLRLPHLEIVDEDSPAPAWMTRLPRIRSLAAQPIHDISSGRAPKHLNSGRSDEWLEEALET
jgi:hypothetical protein